jgi:hypothetical protein
VGGGEPAAKQGGETALEEGGHDLGVCDMCADLRSGQCWLSRERREWEKITGTSAEVFVCKE